MQTVLVSHTDVPANRITDSEDIMPKFLPKDQDSKNEFLQKLLEGFEKVETFITVMRDREEDNRDLEVSLDVIDRLMESHRQMTEALFKGFDVIEELQKENHERHASLFKLREETIRYIDDLLRMNRELFIQRLLSQSDFPRRPVGFHEDIPYGSHKEHAL